MEEGEKFVRSEAPQAPAPLAMACGGHYHGHFERLPRALAYDIAS